MQKHCHCKYVSILYSTQTTKQKNLQRRTVTYYLYTERAHADEHIELRKLGALVARKRVSPRNSVT